MQDLIRELSIPLQNALGDYGVPILQSAVVIVAARVIYPLFVRGLKQLVSSGYFTDSLHNTAVKVIKWLIVVIVVLLILSFFGLTVTSLWVTLSGVAALVALGFVAMWSVLSNITCSIMLVTFAPFRIGDEIQVQDPSAVNVVHGRVISINMMFTTLRTIDDTNHETDNLTRIPNNIFFQKYTHIVPGRATTSLRKYLADQHEQQDMTPSTRQ